MPGAAPARDSGDVFLTIMLDCFRDNTTKVRNIKQYLLASLYNAPMTIGSYYTALVQHDMYGKETEGR